MNFKYRARQSDGEIIEGYIDSDSQKNALENLRARNMIVISLNAQGASPSLSQKSSPIQNQSGLSSLKSILSMDIGHIFSGGKVPAKTLMIFFRQLATMESAGIGLAAALDVITGQESNYTLRKILTDVKSKLDRGLTLSQALSQHSAFSALLISLIEAGEEGGMLDYSLEQGASLLEKQEALHSKVRSALFYPVFIMLFAVFVLIFFFLVLVPKFRETFSTMNIELPAITLKIFAMGEWFSANWPIVAIISVSIVAIWITLSRSKFSRRFMDKLKLKLPVVKTLIYKASMARTARTFASLVSAGVPVIRGLEMAEGTAGNSVVAEGFGELRANASKGVSLGDSARQTGVFPVLVSQMMRIGEETGHLDTMLERVANWYDNELDEQIKATVSLLEPVMIVFVGLIIAVIALAIFSPVTSAIVQLS